MEEEQKLSIAKKNYQRFIERINKILDKDEQEDEYVKAYVFLKNGDVVEDFYWTDHNISPIKIHKWVDTFYNRHDNPREEWVDHIVLPKELYDDVYNSVIRSIAIAGLTLEEVSSSKDKINFGPFFIEKSR